MMKKGPQHIESFFEKAMLAIADTVVKSKKVLALMAEHEKALADFDEKQAAFEDKLKEWKV